MKKDHNYILPIKCKYCIHKEYKKTGEREWPANVYKARPYIEPIFEHVCKKLEEIVELEAKCDLFESK